MKHWIRLNWEAARSTLRDLFRQPVATLLILMMLGIAISLPLALYLAVQSAHSVVGNLSATPQITLYMDMSADELDTQTIEKTLRADARIAEVRFIGKEQALQEMQHSLGDADVVAMFEENPLPDAFAVTPSSTEPQAIQALQQDLNNLPMIDTAQLDARWLQTLHDMQMFLQKILWFLAITLSLAFVLVAHNSIRLQTLARKEEIEITRLLGAPASFIRRPFVYTALWQGLLSLAIGCGLCAWVLQRTAPQLAAILQPYGISLQHRFFTWQELVVIILIVAALAAFGAWLAVRQHLREYAARA
ncbi:MAG: permease-like cell division protein FtsX [Neisseria sp.]|nr:permease-like cell division protein FtsX [Neisseria sp.]